MYKIKFILEIFLIVIANMDNRIITHLNFAKGFRVGERQTLLLIKELSHRGFKQKVITRKKSELAVRLSKINNLEIIKISKPYVLSLNKIKDSSILHAHETKAAQFCYFANALFGIPYIITRRVDNPIKNNFFNKRIYENSTYTAVLSKAIEKETLKISKNINTKIIPSAYSKLEVNQNNVELLKKRFQNKFLLGNIGELDNSHKGQFYLIEAMKKLASTYPNIHLILLGKGKDEINYKNQAKDLNNITFEGFVDNVGDYIQALDLFVFPSVNEGLGSILFDIMQSNVPIIASDVGGIPDIVHHNTNGFLVEPKNSDKIYDAIEKLYLDEDLRKRLLKEAFKNIDNFGFEKMADRYEKIYMEIKK